MYYINPTSSEIITPYHWLPAPVSTNAGNLQTIWDPIGRRVFWHLIWVYTVYTGLSVRTNGKYGNTYARSEMQHDCAIIPFPPLAYCSSMILSNVRVCVTRSGRTINRRFRCIFSFILHENWRIKILLESSRFENSNDVQVRLFKESSKKHKYFIF